MSRKVCAVAAGCLSLLAVSLIAAPLEAATRPESLIVVAGDNTGGSTPVAGGGRHDRRIPRSDRQSDAGSVSPSYIVVAGDRTGGNGPGSNSAGGGR